MTHMDKIDASDIVSWDNDFHKDSYSFLPEKPGVSIDEQLFPSDSFERTQQKKKVLEFFYQEIMVIG